MADDSKVIEILPDKIKVMAPNPKGGPSIVRTVVMVYEDDLEHLIEQVTKKNELR